MSVIRAVHGEPLYGAKLKMDRAETHLKEAERIITDFMAADPYSFEHSFDANQHCHTFRVRGAAIPDSLCAVIGDCIHNLRSALDLMAIELTEVGLRQKSKKMSRAIMDEAGFPICASKSVFEERGRAKVKHWPSVAQTLLEELEPWKDGSHPWSLTVWQIHQLDILDKHKLLIPVGTVFTNDSFSVGYPEPVIREKGIMKFRMQFGDLRDKRFPVEDGAVYLTVLAEHPELQCNMGATFNIGFGKDQIIDGEHVLPTLVRFGQITDSIINTMAIKAF